MLLIDVVNPMDFVGAERLMRHALPMARRIAALKRRARAARVPIIYANDNFGRWRSDFPKLVEDCRGEGVYGRRLVEALIPDDEDYFILKPKHSAFFETNLEILLRSLGARTLVLTGLAGDICVLFTANDAWMRDFSIVVPSDCVASERAVDNRRALALMGRVLRARVIASRSVRFGARGRLVSPRRIGIRSPRA